MKKTKQLLIYGIVLILLAIIELLQLILDFRTGLFELVVHPDKTVQNVTNIILYVLIGFSVLSILIGLYLGGKGIAESRKPSGARLHIVLARVIGTLNLIMMVIVGLSLFNSTDLLHDLEIFGLYAIDMILFYSYASVAKAVRKGKD